MKRLKWVLVIGLLSFWVLNTQAQEKRYKVACIGFYNLENLFDTLDTPNKNDLEFTPKGRNLWNRPKYLKKLKDLSEVISELGTELTPDGAALLGVCEIENRSVLEDLVVQQALKDRDYRIVHYESPDFRGIDNALLYNPKYFTPLKSRALEVLIIDPKDLDTTRTRDILYVAGELDGELVHVMVNHWPSRRGGEKASAYKRNYAASICKMVSDSLREADPNARIIIMGDLNDDPISPSVKKVLKANGKRKSVTHDEFFNPMYEPYRQGIGTLAWRDAWNLFDQILVSKGLLNDPSEGYSFYKSGIYNERNLVQNSGQYKGYPFRTYAGGAYAGGYSDHFPVYIYLIREI